MCARSTIPKALVARIEKRVGPLDAALMTVAARVWQASNPEEFYDAERSVRDAFVERADAVVGALLAERVKASRLVEPTKAELMARAVEAGIKLKSHGRRATRVRLLGGSVVALSTLSLLPVATGRDARKIHNRRSYLLGDHVGWASVARTKSSHRPVLSWARR